MSDYEGMGKIPSFKNMKTGLVVFGILQIILGGVCALIVPFVIMGMIASAVLENSAAPPMNTSMMIPGVLLYALAAVWFISMGIGSIKARRWARALVLVSSWLWLIGGICGLVFVLLLMPNMYNRIGQSGRIPREAVTIMKCVMIGFMTFFYVIVPGVLVLFYGSRNVKATCEFRDSKTRWTDKCPLPVLAVSLIFGSWVVSMLFIGFHGWTIPFFGFVLSGMPGAGVALAVMLLSGYLAWGLYKLNIKAWWCAVLLTILWALSAAITFSRMSMLDFYEKANFPESQLEIIRQCSMFEASTMALFLWLPVAGFLIYLLYIKKYFTPTSAKESASRERDLNI